MTRSVKRALNRANVHRLEDASIRITRCRQLDVMALRQRNVLLIRRASHQPNNTVIAGGINLRRFSVAITQSVVSDTQPQHGLDIAQGRVDDGIGDNGNRTFLNKIISLPLITFINWFVCRFVVVFRSTQNHHLSKKIHIFESVLIGADVFL